ncbi:MAG TPA: ATP-binding protein [Vicinamibacteria bacterium]|nr:ATP-binding protein [Vicinamibacteria bacterium]
MDSAGEVADRRRASAVHVRSILDNTLDAVIALDGAGRVRFWNPRAAEVFGWSRREAIGQELAELVAAPDARQGLRDELERLAGAGEDARDERLEIAAVRRDGSPFQLELSVTVIPSDPEYRFSAFARDVTERQRADLERSRLLVEAEAARNQAESASRVKDEFLSTLSHELRTPLTAIVGWVYLLKSGKLDADMVTRGLEAIDRNAAAQARVISDIIDLSRIVGASFRLSLRPIQLAPVIAAAVDPLIPAANARDIRLQLLLDPTAGLVNGDTDRLRQVVWNLVSNAVKFTPPGGRVTVRLRRVDGMVEIAVEDTGRGIGGEFLPHVFERFRQADSSNTRSHGGLGLGLAVARHLVELHGGHVTAESDGEGEGATFRVTLPRLGDVPAEEGPAEESVAPEPLPDGVQAFGLTPRSLDGVRVLVADDSADVREVIAAILRHAGAEVEAVGSATDALAALVERRPDVLVSEVEMQGESGYSLIRRVRMLPPDAGGAVPAAALSAHGRTEDRVHALLGGFQLHLSKPIQPSELLAVVANLAGRGPIAAATSGPLA